MSESQSDFAEWGDRAVACAIAERALAIVEAGGSKRSILLAREIVDGLWGLVFAPERSHALDLASEAEHLPEFRVEDDRRLSYFAGSALEAISAAANAIGGGPKGDSQPADAALDAFSELDGIVDYPQPTFIDPWSPPPPGGLESAEARRIDLDRNLVSTHSDAVQAAEDVRHRAINDRVLLAADVGSRLAQLRR